MSAGLARRTLMPMSPPDRLSMVPLPTAGSDSSAKVERSSTFGTPIDARWSRPTLFSVIPMGAA